METGSLAAHPARPLVAKLLGRGHRIAARLFARVMELSDCASRLRLACSRPARAGRCCAARSGNGNLRGRDRPRRVAACRPARGRDNRGLRHHPQPVEFPSPKGRSSARRSLAGPESTEATLERLRWLALSLDPGKAFQRHTSGWCQCMRMRSGRQNEAQGGRVGARSWIRGRTRGGRFDFG